jgi:hypothetical protein
MRYTVMGFPKSQDNRGSTTRAGQSMQTSRNSNRTHGRSINVTILSKILMAGLLLMALPQLGWAGIANEHELEVDVCDFGVPKEIAQANASFPVVFTVQVGEDGRALKVERVKNDFLTDKPFVSCIKDWTLPRSSRSLVVTFNWKHAEGWTEIAISGEEVNYRIKFRPGAFSQYSRRLVVQRPRPI